MAYAGTVTVTTKVVASRRCFFVSIAETEAANTSEADPIPLGFTHGRVHRQVCDLTAGTGSTVDPILGTATNPSGANVIIENDVAADPVDNQVVGGVPFYTSTGLLYHRSNVNDATADHSITTHYYITEGW